jgi:hypothetical protein
MDFFSSKRRWFIASLDAFELGTFRSKQEVRVKKETEIR